MILPSELGTIGAYAFSNSSVERVDITNVYTIEETPVAPNEIWYTADWQIQYINASEFGGGIYLGQIRGPEGKVRAINLTSYNNQEIIDK